MRNVYISPLYALVGAALGAVIALIPVLVPWPPYGYVLDIELVFLVPRSWAIALALGGATIGAVLGAVAGRSFVEAGLGFLERITRWMP